MLPGTFSEKGLTLFWAEVGRRLRKLKSCQFGDDHGGSLKFVPKIGLENRGNLRELGV